MNNGFIKVAAATPDIRVADVTYNVEQICKTISAAAGKGAKMIVLPELCITGYTCSDLFWQRKLLTEAVKGLLRITDHTKDAEALVMVGLPYAHDGRLYNVAAVLYQGEILGLVPKTFIPSYAEFYEGRHFTSGRLVDTVVTIDGKQVPLKTKQLFRCRELPEFTAAAEICEDLWVPDPPSIDHGLAGATLIANLSASDETITKDAYRRGLVTSQSARLLCGYIYASAGEGESTTDLVFSGHNLIAENGALLAETPRFVNQVIYGDVDVFRLQTERRRMTSYNQSTPTDYTVTEFSMNVTETKLTRQFAQTPFVPAAAADRKQRCEEIVTIQAMGLKKRLSHTGCSRAVIGISGGLDSTLALLVTARAFDYLEIPRKNIEAVTMPCFGTTDRTYQNACQLTESLGATLREVSVKAAVQQHFADIGHDPSVHDVTYENSQARERTQILMDIANELGGLVIGTGDLSELALGWATYNGDHMSMYGVNCSIPKTLVRHLVRYFADTAPDDVLRKVLTDVLDTPVSPELLPPEGGVISQKTEDLVGPYELHDFFLYYMLRWGYEPSKIFRLACLSFAGTYDRETIMKWEKNFYRRFFSQQFKRSCLPDGPKVGSVAVSPRGDLRMPSDAVASVWMAELESLAGGA